MKQFLLVTTAFFIITPLAAMNMTQKLEIKMNDRDYDTQLQPHITIINELPKNLAPKTHIDVSDGERIDIQQNTPYIPDSSTVSVLPQEGIRFNPRANTTLSEYKRLGMNNAGTGALLKLYIHAAAQEQLFKLYVSNNSEIKFGDTIRVKLDPLNNMLVIHDNNENKILKKMRYSHIVETLGEPDYDAWPYTPVDQQDPLLLVLCNAQK